jgi:hypothetical protein
VDTRAASALVNRWIQDQQSRSPEDNPIDLARRKASGKPEPRARGARPHSETLGLIGFAIVTRKADLYSEEIIRKGEIESSLS